MRVCVQENVTPIAAPSRPWHSKGKRRHSGDTQACITKFFRPSV